MNNDLFQAPAAEGAAAKRSKSGDDVEIDMREEAQKGRVSKQREPNLAFLKIFILCLSGMMYCGTPDQRVLIILIWF